MKKLLITLCALFALTAAKAQAVYEDYEGRIFYDSAHTNLKEVYHYYLRYKYTVSYSRGDTTISPVPVPIKHGVCILYRADGTIDATGQYKEGKQTGQWLFYDKTGKNVIRKENFG
jgi:antitoxin component YwqK of YwqJK toxin-antitoxin module